MPLLDMPLAQLQTYQGSSPRPDRFDAYWADALEEMRSIDSDVVIKEADYQVYLHPVTT